MDVFTLQMDDGRGQRFALQKTIREAQVEARRGDPTVTFQIDHASFTMTQAAFGEMVRLVRMAFATGIEAEDVAEWEKR